MSAANEIVKIKHVSGLNPKQLKTIIRQYASASLPKGKAKMLMVSAENADKPALISIIEREIPSDEVATLIEKVQIQEEEARKTNNAAGVASSRVGNLNRGARTNKVQQGNASPAQMKQQAAMMKKDPAMFRRMVPEMKNFTDAEIREYAEQMEKMADNPEMYKQMQQMQKMDDKSRETLVNIQTRLSGEKPIDAEFIRKTVKAFKAKPNDFKTMIQSQAQVTDDSLDTYFNFFAGLSEGTLVFLAHALWWLSSALKPCVKVYKVVDGYMFGYARYLLFAIGMIVLYFVTVFTFAQIANVFSFIRGLIWQTPANPAE